MSKSLPQARRLETVAYPVTSGNIIESDVDPDVTGSYNYNHSRRLRKLARGQLL